MLILKVAVSLLAALGTLTLWHMLALPAVPLLLGVSLKLAVAASVGAFTYSKLD